jgi:hypothetical protein
MCGGFREDDGCGGCLLGFEGGYFGGLEDVASFGDDDDFLSYS